MSSFDTLIFDFDGTIADTVKLYVLAYQQIHKRYGLPKLKKSDCELFKNLSLGTLIKEYQLGPVKLMKIASELNQTVGGLIKQAHFFPQMKEILLALRKKYRLALLSSNQMSNIEAFFKQENLVMADVFSFWRCDKQIFGKDRALLNLAKKEQFNLKKTLYFGDQVRDIEACRRAKVAIAAVSWGFASEELLAKAEPDFLLNNPQEIVDLLLV